MTTGDDHAARSPDLPTGDDLPSTTDELLAICPRFRVLVIGRSGAGKSTLINTTFGVNEATESHLLAGVSDINKEIFCKANQQFVLHDSQGFEGGENKNLEIVQNFLQSRAKMPMQDQVHAVWLCLPIPTAGGRILETGIEQFLNMKTSGKFGKLPVIAIFTKYDELVSRADREMDSSLRSKLDVSQISEHIKKEAEATRKKVCVLPFEKHTKKKVPHITVSTRITHEQTLEDLVKLTTDSVREHVTEEASLVSAIAQRVNPDVKIEASIAVGKRRYWSGLASSISFLGKPLDACFEVIRGDIVVVWNIPDSNEHLLSSEFQALMLGLVGGAATDQEAAYLFKRDTAAISDQLAYIAGPAAPIVVPIVKFARWVYGIYQETPDVLLHLMTYIVDLILVMQILFLAAGSTKRPILRHVIKLVVGAYKESIVKTQVHSAIQQYVNSAGVFVGADRDNAFNTVTNLINRYRKDPEIREILAEILAKDHPAVDEE